MSTAPDVAGRGWLRLWTALAALLTFAAGWAVLRWPFVEPNGWVAAHFAIMGRVFAETGAWAQGWIPIQSNPPQGTQPEIYIHWPPLFPVLLGWVYALFGAGEAAGRALMMALLAANTTVVALLARRHGGPRAGWWAAIAFLSLPIVLNEGFLVLHLHLAILGALVALWAFQMATTDAAGQDRPALHRGWAAAGIVALGIGLWASWEPALLCPGLLAAAWLRARADGARPISKHPALRLAVLYCGVGAVLAVSVLGIFALQTPSMVDDLQQVARFRAGAAPTYLATGGARQPSLPRLLFRYQERLELLGPLALLAIGAVLAAAIARRRRILERPATTTLAALFSFWLLWFVLMRGHAFFHDYQMLLAAPLAAVSIGLGAERLARWTSRLDAAERRLAALVLFVVLPLVLMKPLVVSSYLRVSTRVVDTPEIAHARQVRQATPEGSVVLSPFGGMVVSYYTERRTLRGVLDDARVEEVLGEMRAAFEPGTPFYLAVPPPLKQDFPETLARYPVEMETVHLVLVRLEP